MTHDPLRARLRTRLGMQSAVIDEARLRDLHWRAARPLLVAVELIGVESDLAVRWHDEHGRALAHGELARASTISCGRLALRRGRQQVGELCFREPLGDDPQIEAQAGARLIGAVPLGRAREVETLAVRLAEALRDSEALTARPKGAGPFDAQGSGSQESPARSGLARLLAWLGSLGRGR